tara:strand:- start:19633 stop:19830 length:198 start_codon:yes stop_codon:yes gene_type:complete
MTQKDEKYYLDIIDAIQDIRATNNGNWMDILRLAFKHSPKEAGEIMSKIYSTDERITELAKKLTN